MLIVHFLEILSGYITNHILILCNIPILKNNEMLRKMTGCKYTVQTGLLVIFFFFICFYITQVF